MFIYNLKNLFVISAQKWIENLFGEMEWFYWLSYTFGYEDLFLNNINLHSDRWIQFYNLINIWLATSNSCHSSRNGFILFFDIYDFNAFFSFFFFGLFVIRVQSESSDRYPCSVGELFFIAWFAFNVGSIDSLIHLLKSAISSDKCNKSLTLSSK